MNSSAPTDTASYWYDLPEERIALYPSVPRDESRLLVFRDDRVDHAHFRQITDFLPADALLIINDTKVIPARLLFYSPNGATVEVFLLQPVSPSVEPATVLHGGSPCRWVCTIGNLKRWKDQACLTLQIDDKVVLHVELIDRVDHIVEFTWAPAGLSFSEVIEIAGKTPLPPYINRQAIDADRQSYQTIYSQNSGAVAAPTAGLHFTERVLQSVRDKGIEIERVTLHVGAGTFMPIKTSQINLHKMHGERIEVSRQTLERLMNFSGPVIPVGTTAVRTLESLYWFGVKLANDHGSNLVIDQNDPYREWTHVPSTAAAIQLLLDYLNETGQETIHGYTSLFIRPGYRFRFCDALITNFHQPESTLLVLISALMGASWRNIYTIALNSGYRFLSYGDSSLIFPLPNFKGAQKMTQ